MNFIFDVDGTLIDSYPGIIKTVIKVLNNHNLNIKKEIIETNIYKYSVRYYLNQLSTKLGYKENILIKEFEKLRIETEYDYEFIDGVINTLKLLKENNNLFIYTHRNNSIFKILKDNNIDNLFTHVISSESSYFKRKPDSYSLEYLIARFDLKREDTYYVGDRPIDILSSNNANIKSVLFNNKQDDLLGSNPTLIIKDFKELLNIKK